MPFVLEPLWRNAEAWGPDARMQLELLLQRYYTHQMVEFGVEHLERKATKEYRCTSNETDEQVLDACILQSATPEIGSANIQQPKLFRCSGLQ
jgi:hypothetical protein